MTDNAIADTSNWYSEDAATFGDRLAGARQVAGLDQAGLARRLGVKLKTLQKWENDLAEPRANRLSMMSGLLNVSLRWLLTGEGDGLSGPPDPEGRSANLPEIMTEIRMIRSEMVRSAERLGRLEKRLRASQPGDV